MLKRHLCPWTEDFPQISRWFYFCICACLGIWRRWSGNFLWWTAADRSATPGQRTHWLLIFHFCRSPILIKNAENEIQTGMRLGSWEELSKRSLIAQRDNLNFRQRLNPGSKIWFHILISYSAMDPTPTNAKPKVNFTAWTGTKNESHPLPDPSKEIQPARREEAESIAMEKNLFKELIEVIR